MKSVIALLAVLSMTGCANMTPMQKKLLTATAAVLVAGAIVAHNDGHRSPGAEPVNSPAGPPCTPQPNGTCR